MLALKHSFMTNMLFFQKYLWHFFKNWQVFGNLVNEIDLLIITKSYFVESSYTNNYLLFSD